MIDCVHIASAVLALLLGVIVILQPKGTRRHVITGRLYGLSMLTVNGAALIGYFAHGHWGPFHTLAVISNIAPARAPAGSALVAAAMTGVPRPGDPALEPAARRQMELWFGRTARDWRLLRIDRIAYAHPNQDPPALDPPQRPVRARPGLYVCGDHVDNASIDGALTSGRRAAEAVLTDLERRG